MMLRLCFQEKPHLCSLVNMYNVTLTDFKQIKGNVLSEGAEKQEGDTAETLRAGNDKEEKAQGDKLQKKKL